MTTALNKFLFSVVRDCFTSSKKTLAVAFKQHLILQVNLGKETDLIFQQCISYLGSRLLLYKNILELLAILSSAELYLCMNSLLVSCFSNELKYLAQVDSDNRFVLHFSHSTVISFFKSRVRSFIHL